MSYHTVSVTRALSTRPPYPGLTSGTHPDRSWDKYVGGIWANILKECPPPRDGIIIEIAPGSVPKIGYGLQDLGFRGQIHIVEPEGHSQNVIRLAYQELLPDAEIIVHQQFLRDAIPHLPQHPSAIVANHPLDDFIAGKSLSTTDFAAHFFDHYSGEQAATTAIWGALAVNPELLNRLISETANDFIELIQICRPKLFAIAQYRSFFFQSHGLDLPDDAAWRALQLIESALLTHNLTRQNMTNGKINDPNRWLVCHGCTT